MNRADMTQVDHSKFYATARHDMNKFGAGIEKESSKKAIIVVEHH